MSLVVFTEEFFALTKFLTRRTRTVGVAGAGAVRVLAAVVPAAALGHLLRRLANLSLGVEDGAVAAAELVRLATKIASEEKLAVGRVREDGVLLEQALRSDALLARAAEALDLGKLLFGAVRITALGARRSRVLVHAGADFDVEQKGAGAGHLVGGALVTANELVAGRRMVEEAVSSLALGVDSRRRFLPEVTLAAIDILGIDATLAIPRRVIEHETVVAEDRLVFAVATEEIEIALVLGGEAAVLLRTTEVVGRPDEVKVGVG